MRWRDIGCPVCLAAQGVPCRRVVTYAERHSTLPHQTRIRVAQAMTSSQEPDRKCVLCSSQRGPFARSSRSGFKKVVCASEAMCKVRRKINKMREAEFDRGWNAAVAALKAKAEQCNAEANLDMWAVYHAGAAYLEGHVTTTLKEVNPDGD